MALNKRKDTRRVDAIVTKLESVEWKSQLIWGNGNVLLMLTSPRKALGYKVRWYLKPPSKQKELVKREKEYVLSKRNRGKVRQSKRVLVERVWRTESLGEHQAESIMRRLAHYSVDNTLEGFL